MPGREAQRLDKLRRALRAARVEALLVTSTANVGYLTGFTGEDSALLVTDSRALVVSDGRYATQLEQECPDFEAHIRPVDQTLMAAVAGVVGKLGVGSLGFEPAALSVADHETLSGHLASVALRGVTGQVEALRAIKDRDEIADIRRAIAIAERAFAMLRAGLRLDASEKEAADDLEAFLRRCGAASASFPPIVAVGRNAASPHHRGSDAVRLGRADFALIDWGATSRPYKSDLTRVLVTGKVTPKFARVYRSVLSAQGRAIAAIRPGVKGSDVDAEARSSLEEAGFGRFFTHGLGHGLGREIHEAPNIRPGVDDPLRPGMVLTVEPGVYLPDWGGIRIEDDVLVTPDGREVLTGLPRDLDSVRVD